MTAPLSSEATRSSLLAREPKSKLSTLARRRSMRAASWFSPRSEEHTSELQSRFDLVCRLLLEKKKNLSLQTHSLLTIALQFHLHFIPNPLCPLLPPFLTFHFYHHLVCVVVLSISLLLLLDSSM